MRILYFDCIAGISGDMALGALIQAGADADAIRGHLASLPVEPFEFLVDEVETHGIHAVKVTVRAERSGVVRTYANIRSMLDGADLPEGARSIAQRIFRRLAEAEAVVHHRDIEQVAFHEVGAVDSIVDIVGTALALDQLGVERVFASPVPTGMGMTKTEHGMMPIPAPAVVELLRGAPLFSRNTPFELVTPTGAAILASLVEGYGGLPTTRTGAIGYGAGTPRQDFPNVLRVLIGDGDPTGSPSSEGPAEAGVSDEVLLETNVDDLNPELYTHVLERLFEAGAQDAWLTPIVMKKGRPAVTVVGPGRARTRRGVAADPLPRDRDAGHPMDHRAEAGARTRVAGGRHAARARAREDRSSGGPPGHRSARVRGLRGDRAEGWRARPRRVRGGGPPRPDPPGGGLSGPIRIARRVLPAGGRSTWRCSTATRYGRGVRQSHLRTTGVAPVRTTRNAPREGRSHHLGPAFPSQLTSRARSMIAPAATRTTV